MVALPPAVSLVGATQDSAPAYILMCFTGIAHVTNSSRNQADGSWYALTVRDAMYKQLTK
eukprot:4689723-Pleurochrysis_carterae.AAC.2